MMKWASLRDPRERRDASGLVVIVAAVLALVGGCETPSPHTISRNYGLRPDIPVDPPRPHSAAEDDCAHQVLDRPPVADESRRQVVEQVGVRRNIARTNSGFSQRVRQ